MVRLQLSSRSEICKPVLLELLGADSYEERMEGRDINIAAHSLILNQPRALQKFWVHAWVVYRECARWCLSLRLPLQDSGELGPPS
jgi:hypothetical protein